MSPRYTQIKAISAEGAADRRENERLRVRRSNLSNTDSAALTADHEVNAPAGKYSLVFEALPGDITKDHDYAFVFNVKFCTDLHPDFEILKQGEELTTNRVLRKDA